MTDKKYIPAKDLNKLIEIINNRFEELHFYKFRTDKHIMELYCNDGNDEILCVMSEYYPEKVCSGEYWYNYIRINKINKTVNEIKEQIINELQGVAL